MPDDRPINRPITYTDDSGIIFYRASAFGSCPRALYASRKGYSPDPYPEPVLQAFADGNANEAHIQQLVEEQGWLTYDHQAEVSFKLGPVVVVGHIDWMIKNPNPEIDETYVCDAKALSDSNFKLWRTYGFERFPKYAWQLSIYARGTKAPICMAVLNKETGELDLTFPPTPHSFSDMLERVIEIERFIKDGGDQPPCVPDGFFCPYSYLHDTMFDDVSLSGGMEQLRQNEMWDLAHQYQAAKRAEVRAKNQASELLHEIEIKLHADEKNVKVRKTGAPNAIAIVRVNQKRKTIDTELLGGFLRSQAHSLTEFETVKESSYIRVSTVKKAEAEEDAATTTSAKRLGENPSDGGTGDVKDNIVAEHSEVVS